jgi:methyl-accepting chemotaxis protein
MIYRKIVSSNWLFDFQKFIKQVFPFALSQQCIVTHLWFFAALIAPFVFSSWYGTEISAPGALASSPAKASVMAFVYYLSIGGGFWSAYSALWRGRQERDILHAAIEKAKKATEGTVQLDFAYGYEYFFKIDTASGRADRLASVRMVQRIWQQACEMRYDPMGVVTPSYLTELTAGTRSLKSWQLVAIRLGILGTFAGLLVILGGLAGKLAKQGGLNDPKELFSLVESMTDQLSLAFGTSVAGLGAALFLQVELELVIKRAEARIARNLEVAVIEVQGACSRGTLSTSLLHGVDALNKSINRHAEQISSQRESLRKGMDDLKAEIGEERKGIASRLEALSQLISLIRNEVNATGELREALHKLLDRIEEFRSQVQAIIREQARNFTEASAAAMQNIMTSISRLTGAVETKAAADVGTILIRIEEILVEIKRRQRFQWIRSLLVALCAVWLAIGLLFLGAVAANPDLQKFVLGAIAVRR